MNSVRVLCDYEAYMTKNTPFLLFLSAQFCVTKLYFGSLESYKKETNEMLKSNGQRKFTYVHASNNEVYLTSHTYIPSTMTGPMHVNCKLELRLAITRLFLEPQTHT